MLWFELFAESRESDRGGGLNEAHLDREPYRKVRVCLSVRRRCLLRVSARDVSRPSSKRDVWCGYIFDVCSRICKVSRFIARMR
jgi:hypothetical protein